MYHGKLIGSNNVSEVLERLIWKLVSWSINRCARVHVTQLFLKIRYVKVYCVVISTVLFFWKIQKMEVCVFYSLLSRGHFKRPFT